MTRLRALREQGRKALERQVGMRANQARNIMVGMLSQPGEGEVYELTRPRRTHRASKPGDPPAVDTGRLRGSISIKKVNSLRYMVGTSVEYAAYLEFGTMRVRPRPWARPSAAILRQDMRRGTV